MLRVFVCVSWIRKKTTNKQNKTKQNKTKQANKQTNKQQEVSHPLLLLHRGLLEGAGAAAAAATGHGLLGKRFPLC